MSATFFLVRCEISCATLSGTCTSPMSSSLSVPSAHTWNVRLPTLLYFIRTEPGASVKRGSRPLTAFVFSTTAPSGASTFTYGFDVPIVARFFSELADATWKLILVGRR